MRDLWEGPEAVAGWLGTSHPQRRRTSSQYLAGGLRLLSQHCGALAALPLCNGTEVVAVCHANLVLSATLRPCGVLRDGALHAAAVQPNREPALSRLFLARLARAANNPTRLGSPMQVRPMPRATGRWAAFSATTQTQNHVSV